MKNIPKFYNKPAFVLGMGLNGLSVVRSLARAGVRVIALDPDSERFTMSTRYAKCLTCPCAKTQPGELRDFLVNLAHQEGGAVLFPTNDLHNDFVSRYRNELRPELIFHMPGPRIMDKLGNKEGQYELAKAHYIPVPKTMIPKNADEVKAIAGKLKYPVILKGIDTVAWRAHFGDQKALVVNSADDLLEQFSQLPSEKSIKVMIQEIIEGDDTRHFKLCAYFDRKGRPLHVFTLQKIRQYPCDFGIGCTVISRWEPEVAAIGLKFFKDMGYQGIGSIEFKRDKRDDQLKMIEVNPRLWAQNSLADACGQNFALTAYRDCLGENVPEEYIFQDGVKWIAFKEDRASFYGYRKQGRLTLFNWLRSYLGGQKIWSTWAWDDPMPFFKVTKFGLLPFVRAGEKLRDRGARKKADQSNQGSRDGHSQKIKVDIITDTQEFYELGQDWNAVLQECQPHNPFLSHEWLSSWWQGYGQDKKLFVIRFQKEGRTIGFAPLMTYQTKLTGVKVEAIGFLSNHWTRMDFLISQEHEQCLRELAKLLKTLKLVIILAQMNTESRGYQIFLESLRAHHVPFRETAKSHAVIELKGSWKDYFDSQSKNFRMDSRRKLKRLESMGKVLFEKSKGFNPTILLRMRSVAQNCWQSKESVNIVMTQEGGNFYNAFFQKKISSVECDVSFLMVNDQPIAYMVGLIHEGRYFAFDTAYDRDYHKFSPGLILHNKLLERLYQEKRTAFDFGFIADYKKRWSEDIISMKDLVIYPQGILGRGIVMASDFKQKLRKETVSC